MSDRWHCMCHGMSRRMQAVYAIKAYVLCLAINDTSVCVVDGFEFKQ